MWLPLAILKVGYSDDPKGSGLVGVSRVRVRDWTVGIAGLRNSCHESADVDPGGTGVVFPTGDRHSDRYRMNDGPNPRFFIFRQIGVCVRVNPHTTHH